MKDAFHGSAHPAHGLVTASRGSTPPSSTPIAAAADPAGAAGRPTPRRSGSGAPGAHCVDRLPRIVLDIDANLGRPFPAGVAGPGVGRNTTVPTAYALRYDTHVRPAMPNNPISLKSLVAVAEARASFADHRTGRDCRPTNARLAEITGLSVRTVQRASTALRLLGVATEVMRGRQRTRAERFASWRVGDKGRGWASVWALHDCRFQVAVTPSRRVSVRSPNPRKSLLTTATRRPAAGSSAATRRPSPETRALALANKWVLSQQSPPWARRYRTGTPWARVLAGPARHGWTPRDVNTPHPRLGRHRALAARKPAQAHRAARRDTRRARRPDQPPVGT